jgi:hypothetical protein
MYINGDFSINFKMNNYKLPGVYRRDYTSGNKIPGHD